MRCRFFVMLAATAAATTAAAAATGVIVAATAAAAQNDNKDDDPKAAAATETIAVIHGIASFFLISFHLMNECARRLLWIKFYTYVWRVKRLHKLTVR